MANLKVKDYQPIQGFYDLGDFVIPAKEFMAFWRIQKFLFSCEQARKRGTCEYMPHEFAKVQELSAQYQQALFKFKASKRTGAE